VTAVAGAFSARQHLLQCALARARGPKQPKDLAVRNREAHGVDGGPGLSGIAEGQVLGQDGAGPGP
jgi:hypothetical protein